MLKIDKALCLDLADDVEGLGLQRENFSLDSVIQGDENRAFALGYCFDNMSEKVWFSPRCRKELRHTSDGITDVYNPQLDWINKKIGGKPALEYANEVMDNLFYNSKEDRIKIALLLGKQLSKYKLFDE